MASQISGVTDASSFGTNDSVAWGQLGQPFYTFTGGIAAVSSAGIQVTGTSQNLERVDEGFGWIGIFPMNDQLLWNQDSGNPVTFTFATPVNGAGALAQGDYIGAFSVTLTAFDGTANLGSFSVSGDNTLAEDGSAPFVGVLSASPIITSVVFSESDPSGSNHFALDTLELSAAVPEPSSASLLLLALSAGAVVARFRRKSV